MSSSSDSSGAIAFALFAAGPAAGIATWSWIQAKYRNRSARYMPERTVAHKVTKLTPEDAFSKRIVSTESSISGRNESNHTLRLPFSKAVKN